MPKVPEQPERFFEETKVCLAHLRGIPMVAIEAIATDQMARGPIVAIVRACFEIFRNAGVDMADEMVKQIVRDAAEDNLKDIMRNDRNISMEELNAKGLKLHFTDNGPVVVPA